MRALILDPGGSRSALAGVRALGRAGFAVGVASPVASFVTRSRFVRAWVPVAGTDVAALASVASGWDVVVPAGDAEAFAVSEARAELPCRVPYGLHSSVARALDKAVLSEVAASVGVAVPRSGDGGELEPPVVVKGRSHVSGRREAVVAQSRSEVAAARAALGDDAVVQEFVDGPLVAVSVVADSSCRVVARVQQRALAVWPVGAGVSTRAVTEAVDAELAAGVDRLVTALEWQGLAQFQFLVGADGVPRLIDCNPRLYGSLSLAAAAGVNLAALWVGGESGSGSVARVGARYQWLEGDVRRAPRAALSSVAWGLGAQHSITSAADPRPALAYGWSLARRAARKARR